VNGHHRPDSNRPELGPVRVVDHAQDLSRADREDGFGEGPPFGEFAGAELDGFDRANT